MTYTVSRPTDLARLLGASFADPDRAAPHGAERVLIQDEFDNLPASQSEIHAESEPPVRGIEHETGKPHLVSLEIDDQAGALLRDDPLRSPAFRNGRGRHRAAPQA
jgi:hypothetical protein